MFAEPYVNMKQWMAKMNVRRNSVTLYTGYTTLFANGNITFIVIWQPKAGLRQSDK